MQSIIGSARLGPLPRLEAQRARGGLAWAHRTDWGSGRSSAPHARLKSGRPRRTLISCSSRYLPGIVEIPNEVHDGRIALSEQMVRVTLVGVSVR
jgi:hypothetical protein